MNPRFTPPPRQFAGYVFDCDGTLADTMPLHFQAWRSALGAAGVRFSFDWELFISRAGMSLEHTVQELSAQFDLELDPVQIASHQRTHYEELEASVRAVPGVLEFARHVASFAPISVASGSNRQSVLRSLELIGAADLFSVIITPADVPRGKPHPDMFLLAAARMGELPSECLVLEDGELGFEAARRAGMPYLQVFA